MADFCEQHQMMVGMAKEVHDMHACLLGDDSSDAPTGLRAKVERHDEVIRTILRIVWIGIGVGVTAVITIIIKGAQ